MPTEPPDATEIADAGAGGCGAPPQPVARNRAPKGLTREYRSAGINVLWFAKRCIHSAECIRALPGVFDPGRRPWIDLGAASADDVADAVLRCPTGALHYVRHDGGEPEPVPEEVTVRTTPNGPYLVRGLVEITNDSGDLIRRDTRVALCRCGRSEDPPFCDNSHRASGFRDPGLVPESGSEPASPHAAQEAGPA